MKKINDILIEDIDKGIVIADVSGEYVAVKSKKRSYVIDFSSSGTSYRVTNKKKCDNEPLGVFEVESSSFLDDFIKMSPFNEGNPVGFKHFRVELNNLKVDIISKIPPFFCEVINGFFETNEEYHSKKKTLKSFWNFE